jgi:hypothetical protein
MNLYSFPSFNITTDNRKLGLFDFMFYLLVYFLVILSLYCLILGFFDYFFPFLEELYIFYYLGLRIKKSKREIKMLIFQGCYFRNLFGKTDQIEHSCPDTGEHSI